MKLVSLRWYAAATLLFIWTLPVAAQAQATPPAGMERALDHISADSLKGHVSFLASDLLEGRATPSRGLDIAAEYIASQFRRSGLEPGGDDGYFETARFYRVKPDYGEFEIEFRIGGETFRIPKDGVAAPPALTGVKLDGASIVKANLMDLLDSAAWPAERVRGKVIVTELPDFTKLDEETRRKVRRTMRSTVIGLPGNLPEIKAAALIVVAKGRFPREDSIRMIDPEDASLSGTPRILVFEAGLRKAFESMPEGESGATVSVKIPDPVKEEVKLRNVVGILRGSDPVLKDTYVLVSAHYDHIGMRATGEGDRINNGANDDASGTASVIELASALSAMPVKPKRSMVFVTYFGEELGLVGSRYYARHPAVPLAHTVADVNLEQLGRTDDNEGPQTASASLTGFDYSDIGPIFATAGEMTGVRVAKRDRMSDSMFARSDNQALADAGIPAHTLGVAFEFPDYHRPGDEWQKLDYANMAKVDRMVAAGLLLLADNPVPPKWNEANPRTASYVNASKQRKGN